MENNSKKRLSKQVIEFTAEQYDKYLQLIRSGNSPVEHQNVQAVFKNYDEARKYDKLVQDRFDAQSIAKRNFPIKQPGGKQ